MSTAPATRRLPKLTNTVQGFISGWNRLGSQTAFNVRVMGLTGEAITRHKVETLRLIATMSLGVGALAIIGGTVVIVATLTMSVGSFIAIQGHRSFHDVGIDALNGFFSAFINTRLSAPLTTDFGLAATIGAGATAQLGAMRINEEIDALEVMGVRTIAYLASTRVVAGVVVAIPLWALATVAGFVATRTLAVLTYDQPAGVFDHYFRTYLQPTDLVWSLIQVVIAAIVIMLVHTYYGFNASGGPAGVGDAVGRAVRASMVVAVAVTLAGTLAIYGASGNFHLSG